jgi:hypothetical protein
MTILNYLRSLLVRSDANLGLEYVNESHAQVSSVECDPVRAAEKWDMQNDVDFTHLIDLEGYARESSLSKKSIEKWISSGLLMPEELKVAEKLIKIMNQI